MMRSFSPEVVFTSSLLLLTLFLSWVHGLPLLMPTKGSATFVGIHYLLPLLGIAAFALCAAVGGSRSLVGQVLVGLPCYAIVLWAHFHLKLWAPLINPTNYDHAFYAIDSAMRPVVRATTSISEAVAQITGRESGLYVSGFILIFYMSFCYHALRTPDAFRKLFLAALVFQGLGGIAYMLLPAIGPFVFERGADPMITSSQEFMYGGYSQLLAGRGEWLGSEGQGYFAAGLGAMPSLHAGGAFLFFWFAWRHGRVLLRTYIPLLAYILVEAVATRWHYLVDLPVGIALALASIALAERLERKRRHEAPEDPAEPLFDHAACPAHVR